MEEFKHYLQGELHEIQCDLQKVKVGKWRDLSTYTLRQREVDMLTTLAVLTEYERVQAHPIG